MCLVRTGFLNHCSDEFSLLKPKLAKRSIKSIDKLFCEVLCGAEKSQISGKNLVIIARYAAEKCSLWRVKILVSWP